MTTGSRDRDTAGRPRNARPRDGLGRPLRRDATGEPVTPDDLRLAPADAVLTAQRLIDAGRPFHAHEVLEAAWKSAPAAEREVWRGLAQMAVGLTHALRGNSRGAVTLLRRGAAAVGSYPGHGGQPGELPANLDLAAARAGALLLADRIASGGLTALADGDVRLRLTAAR
ncbi:MAG TPA: DUF309 domain-containing protein [Streptosporangiaceae bacterium]|nr:DUF309 domain-containing protein [Streptosporangiaceae bacterium]